MQLVRLGTEEHALVVTAHHIICDGWSVNVLLDELARLYAGEAVPAPVRFSTYALAEQANPRDSDEAEAYWLAQFVSPANPLDLPPGRARPAVKSYSGATYRVRWSKETTRLIRGAGAAQGCTLFVTLLSAFGALLARLANQPEVVVGVPTAAQSQMEDGAMVGHAVNLLPIRVLVGEPEAALSFAAFPQVHPAYPARCLRPPGLHLWLARRGAQAPQRCQPPATDRGAVQP